jgi:hypothetical protein
VRIRLLPIRLRPRAIATLNAHGLLAIYSKMFIGGLNWDTTDGTYSAHYTSSYTVVLKEDTVRRITPGLLYAVRKSRCVHNYARCCGSVEMFCLFNLRGTGERQCRNGQGTFLGWQDRASIPYLIFSLLLIRIHII